MKIFLAPLHGLTLAFYRNLYEEFFGGIDTYYAPFIATSSMRKANSPLFRDVLPENNDPNIHLVPQLLGNNGDDFNYFAHRIADLGYEEINWNVGCPHPPVAKKKRGSGIMPYPDMIDSLLDQVCREKDYNLSVKIRLGYHHLDEGLEVMKVLNQYPLSSVIIHGRTGLQMYEGTVDLDAFDQLLAASQHDITYNGDIFTYEDFLRIQERYPQIDKFMLGRGALRDPFLPSIIKNNGQTQENEMDKIRQLHDRVHHHYQSVLSGDKHLCDKMKEFWSYLALHLDPSGKLLKKFKKCRHHQAYMSLVNEIFSSYTKWR